MHDSDRSPHISPGARPARPQARAGETPALPRGWHYRGYLPHFDGGEIPQFVTFRLADSLPKAVLQTWQDQLQGRPRSEASRELGRRVEHCLDQGLGHCFLRDPRVGGMVQESLLFFDRSRYRLHAWVVMPNHVHVLFTPSMGHALADILHSWKSYTAKQANRILSRTGQFWEEDYFDRFIRDEIHFAATAAYIENNPVKAGLCARPEDWPLSSAARSADVPPAHSQIPPSGRDARAPSTKESQP